MGNGLQHQRQEGGRMNGVGVALSAVSSKFLHLRYDVWVGFGESPIPRELSIFLYVNDILYCILTHFLKRNSTPTSPNGVTSLIIILLRVLARGILSVCPSVTFRYCVQTNEDTIVRFSASGRTLPLVSGEVKFIRIFGGDHPQQGR